MIDPSMDALVNYLMKMRGEGGNPMMPPVQQQDPVAMLMQNMPQQQQSPLATLLASAQQPQAQPTPGMLGSGVASQAASLLELQKLAKEAALQGDFDKADAYSRKIQELQQGRKYGELNNDER